METIIHFYAENTSKYNEILSKYYMNSKEFLPSWPDNMQTCKSIVNVINEVTNYIENGTYYWLVSITKEEPDDEIKHEMLYRIEKEHMVLINSITFRLGSELAGTTSRGRIKYMLESIT